MWAGEEEEEEGGGGPILAAGRTWETENKVEKQESR